MNTLRKFWELALNPRKGTLLQKKIFFLCSSLLYLNSGDCRIGEFSLTKEEKNEPPWFTGPLLAPSGYVVPLTQINLEPYLFVTNAFGIYDEDWHAHSAPKTISIVSQTFCKIGVSEKIDFRFTPEFTFKHIQKKSSSHISDLPLGFDFQILKEQAETWYPAIKLGVGEIFPTGKYQKLNPKKNRSDISGRGSFITDFSLVFARLFYFGGIYYLNSRLAFINKIPTSVHVKGFNTYGGGFRTRGKVSPGNIFTSILGLEFSFTRHWALALDIQNVHESKSRFKGNHGTNIYGMKARVGRPSLEQWSLAPAIEYNFTESLGLIAGCWFSIAGRNTDQFYSGVIALNWYGTIFSTSKK